MNGCKKRSPATIAITSTPKKNENQLKNKPKQTVENNLRPAREELLIFLRSKGITTYQLPPISFTIRTQFRNHCRTGPERCA